MHRIIALVLTVALLLAVGMAPAAWAPGTAFAEAPAAPPAAPSASTPAYGVQMLGVTVGNDLALWSSTDPGGTFINLGPIEMNDPDAMFVIGITVRPSSGQIYVMSDNKRLGTLNPATGQVTNLSPAPLDIQIYGNAPIVPMAIDPVADVIRIFGDDNQNYRISPVTGLLLGEDTPLDRECPWTSIANSNPYRGAGVTSLYAVDTFCPELGHIGGLNGTPPPPSSGQSFTLGDIEFPPTTIVAFLDSFNFPPGTQSASLTYASAYELDENLGEIQSLYSIPVTGTAPYQATRLGIISVGSSSGSSLAPDTRPGAGFGRGGPQSLNRVTCGCPDFIAASIVLPTGVAEMAVTGVSVNENAGTVDLQVTRLGGTWDTITVAWATQDGTARAGIDYVAGSGVLTFPQGQTNQTITVGIINNTAGTGNRFFDVTLGAVSANSNSGTQPTTRVTILDLSPAIVQFASPGFSALASNGVATAKVVRTGNSATAASVQYATSDGTAQAGVDYLSSAGGINFSPGETVAYIDVTLLPNPGISGKEFSITLTPVGSGVVIGPVNPTTITIVDDVTPPVMRWASPAVAVKEADGRAIVNVTRLGSLAGTSTVNFATADGTAIQGVNYTATGGTLTFQPGVASLPVTVPILFDPGLTGAVNFTITLSGATGGSVGQPSVTTITIVDPGDVPHVQFGAATFSVAEGTPSITLPVTRIGNVQEATSVAFATRDGTAVAGVNYVARTDTLIFYPGQEASSITIQLLDEPAFTPSKTFFVDLDAVTGGKLGVPPTAAVTIVDPSAPPSLQFAFATYRIGETNGQVVLNVTRLGTTAGTVTVQFATRDGTAVAGTNYTATSGTLSFGPGVVSQTITVPIINAQNPSILAFLVDLSSPGGGAVLGSPSRATVVIDPMRSRFPVVFRNFSGGW